MTTCRKNRYGVGIVAVGVTLLSLLTSCIPLNDGRDTLAAAIAIPLDGVARNMVGNLASLGVIESDSTLQISAGGTNVRRVLLLRADAERESTGVMVGGAMAGMTSVYQTVRTGEHFLFVEYNAGTTVPGQTADVSVSLLNDSIERPSRQIVRVVFEDGFLTDPGLLDPVDGTAADRAFLDSIESTVRDEVLASLRNLFDQTPIDIVETDASVAGPVSTLTFSPKRVLADQNDINDAALPPADPNRPQCQVRVVFGEVLPSGTGLDPGNRNPQDDAVVYVGSFQGRGETCRTSAVTSLRSMVLTLSQTGAHEIGHLVGLHHIEQVGIMNRSATLAFQRELSFARGQIQVDRAAGNNIRSEVFPAIVQEPSTYLESIFATESSD